tara:strand:+ start:917 stop:1912 length:996 start_codon:yes stop_codon:yes gene_type:complete
MSITKRAFIQGLQRSLVNAGAVTPYTSKWQAKHALDQAEAKLEEREEKSKEKEPEEMSEEDVSEIMTDIVEAEPLDEAIEALQEYQEAAGDSEQASDALADALEDVKDSKEAALAIRRLKMSNAVGSGSIGNEMLGKGVGNLENGLGAAPQMPKGLRVDMLEPHAHVGPNVDGSNVSTMSANIKDRTSKQEVKTALAILRKLAGENAALPPAAQNLGDHERDPRDEDYATVNPINNVAPVEPRTNILDHNSVAGTGRETLAYLVQKTAQEVGHFLPQELSSSDKLAALRTMVGMNGQERAAYIGRIKEAMFQQPQLDKEAQASQVLRNLGL